MPDLMNPRMSASPICNRRMHYVEQRCCGAVCLRQQARTQGKLGDNVGSCMMKRRPHLPRSYEAYPIAECEALYLLLSVCTFQHLCLQWRQRCLSSVATMLFL